MKGFRHGGSFFPEWFPVSEQGGFFFGGEDPAPQRFIYLFKRPAAGLRNISFRAARCGQGGDSFSEKDDGAGSENLKEVL